MAVYQAVHNTLVHQKNYVAQDGIAAGVADAIALLIKGSCTQWEVKLKAGVICGHHQTQIVLLAVAHAAFPLSVKFGDKIFNADGFVGTIMANLID